MSCWDCIYQQLGGNAFLGYCRYWERLGEEKKEIPPDIVDKGCKNKTWEPITGPVSPTVGPIGKGICEALIKLGWCGLVAFTNTLKYLVGNR